MIKTKYYYTGEDAIKRDNAIIDLLHNYKSVDSPASIEVIQKHLLAQGFPIGQNAIRNAIKRIAYEHMLPLCGSNARGYYWARNRADIIAYKNDLQSRVNALNEHIDFLNNFLVE